MKRIEKELKTKEVKEFYKTILALRNEKECELFLRDLLTFEELQEVARRLKVAKMLTKDISFTQIQDQTKMSSTTISRINFWLHHGTGGYMLVLKRLK